MRRRLGEPALALQLYEAALANAPRRHAIETVLAMVLCASALPDQVLAQRVADGLARGGRFPPAEIRDMASLAALLAGLLRRQGFPSAEAPVVFIDAIGIELETASRRLVYSHFGEGARPVFRP